ncbi:MAG: hypothetical protein K2M06_07130 [Muribaculaceae bacterium]|nr:hypothetical protein [Muribaculaceae bacterium]
MKAIVVRMHEDCGGIKSVRVATDSTLLRTGEPLFVADHLGQWIGEICPAVRISRLGTNIPRKSAGRYFDTMLLAAVVSPLKAEMLPSGVVGLLDRSIAPGEGTDSEALSDEASVLTIESSEGRRQYRFEGLRRSFEEAVHELSRYCTFKTGDLVALSGLGSESIALEPDTELRAELSPGPQLHLRMK